MICPKCEAELPDDSQFCNKCGCQVQNITEDNPSLNDPQLTVENQIPEISQNTVINSVNKNNDFLKKKLSLQMPLSKKIAIIIGALVVCLIGYSGYYQNAYNSAKNLYAQEKYYDAAKRLDGLINLTGDKEFETIKFAKEVGSNYSFYKTEMNHDEQHRSYSNAAYNLFEGLKSCIDAEKKYTDNFKLGNIKDFKNKYYMELSLQFNITQKVADRIAKLDYNEIQDRSNLIAKNKIIDEKQQNDKQLHPLEFSNLSWDSNSSYTIAIGSVKNISDKVVKFATIKISFMDDSGNVIDTASTYAVGEEGLNPGESCKWRASVTADSNIKKYQVSLINFE